MSNKNFFKKTKQIYFITMLFFSFIIVIAFGLVYKIINPSFLTFENEIAKDAYTNTTDFGEIKDGIHLDTGFKEDKGLPIVIASCTPCHSAKLVTQNRATKEGWIGIIRWMQETQNLWDLGENEDVITTYLAKNYGPDDKGRREVLNNIEWYDLED